MRLNVILPGPSWLDAFFTDVESLVDGKRSVADLARLTQRGELDIGYTLARFLQWGYIEPVNMIEYTLR